MKSIGLLGIAAVLAMAMLCFFAAVDQRLSEPEFSEADLAFVHDPFEPDFCPVGPALLGGAPQPYLDAAKWIEEYDRLRCNAPENLRALWTHFAEWDSELPPEEAWQRKFNTCMAGSAAFRADLDEARDVLGRFVDQLDHQPAGE